MSKDNRIASYKYSVLPHAQKYHIITYTYKVFNLSRTVYCQWLKRFSKLGDLGLQDKKKAKPISDNDVIYCINYTINI